MNNWTLPTRRRSIFLFASTLVLLGVTAAGPVRAGQLRSATTRLAVKNPKCVPGQCVCLGSIDASARLNEVGIRASMLKRGISCIVADFDGDGFRDYAIPGAEGSAAVILIGPNSAAKVVVIDAGGVLELYLPRTEPGTRASPSVKTMGCSFVGSAASTRCFYGMARDLPASFSRHNSPDATQKTHAG